MAGWTKIDTREHANAIGGDVSSAQLHSTKYHIAPGFRHRSLTDRSSILAQREVVVDCNRWIEIWGWSAGMSQGDCPSLIDFRHHASSTWIPILSQRTVLIGHKKEIETLSTG